MIITHMPRKLAVLTGVIIAVALGTYYILYLTVVPDGDWQVHYGTGKLEHDSAAGVEYFSVTSQGSRAGRWFEFTRLRVPPGPSQSAQQEFVLSFSARTPTGFVGHVVLTQKAGKSFSHTLALEPTANWVRVALPLKAFKSVTISSSSITIGDDSTKPVETVVFCPGPLQLEPVVWFGHSRVEGDVVLELTGPKLERVMSSK